MIIQLIRMADLLDAHGHVKAADAVDYILRLAADPTERFVDLVKLVKQMREQGFTKEQVAEELKEDGWPTHIAMFAWVAAELMEKEHPVDEWRKEAAADPERSMAGYVACRVADIFADLEQAGWERGKIAKACEGALKR